MIECFWQGRLVPDSHIYRLPFFPDAKRSAGDRDELPDKCLARVRGMLFWQWDMPISNNKVRVRDAEKKMQTRAVSCNGMQCHTLSFSVTGCHGVCVKYTHGWWVFV